MSYLNYEITLYNSPYHDTLLEELSSIIKQKKNFYRHIQSEKDFNEKLSFEERQIIKHLISKENKILYELIEHKGWLKNNVVSENNKTDDNDDEDDFPDYNSGYGFL